MHVSSISLNGSVTVILKVAMGRTYVRNLLKEAEIYLDKLKPLFTSRVPHVYGFWQGETYEGQTAVMVMQDCGRPLKRDIVQQPPKFRQLVIDHLVAVHRAGVSFRDFGMDNVVAFQTPEGSFYPMLVGFGHADGSHECPFKGDIGVYSPQPKEPLPCSQLWHVALMAEAFYQYNVDFYGREISLKTISSTMDLVKMRPEGISEAQALYDADDIIRRFNIWQDRRLAMDNGPVRLD
ncbi:hypothetical protein L227DRAFT_579635 [Lentinus tigrinus ALCF2SS1-6]|uniref:Protein kinase domain-containing protein n=2 Tax=Lentinus tigrinus TaxID=5365 RepID=A0A5C2RVP5_9APHY|nr:hypothetical protein L227DRAFT_579635 [Lentinus tigrinus ALCF2SS1-6]